MMHPVAILTNLAYILAGVWVARGKLAVSITEYTGGDYDMDTWRIRTLSSWLVGLSFIALGLTSGINHYFNDATDFAHYERWAALWDFRGMYLAFSVLAGVVWAPRWINPDTDEPYGWEISVETRWGDGVGSLYFKPLLVWLGLALGIILAAFAHALPMFVVVPALAALCVAGVGVGQSWARAGRFALAFLGILVIRELGEPRSIFGADALFPYDAGHGFWHVYTAGVMLLLYKSTLRGEGDR